MFAERLLRSEVYDRADNRSGSCHRAAGEGQGFLQLRRPDSFCQSEVQNLDAAGGQNKDISRLNVSVQNSFLVRGP